MKNVLPITEDASQNYTVFCCVGFQNISLKYELQITSVFDVQCSAQEKPVEAPLSWINVTVTAGE